MGRAILVAAVFGLYWPPMHQREVLATGDGTWTDTLHIAWTVGNGVLTLIAVGFGAAALGGRFRLYSLATLVVLIACEAWTASYAGRLETNLPTPGMGVWERINIGSWLLWVAVLAVSLLRRRDRFPAPPDQLDGIAGDP